MSTVIEAEPVPVVIEPSSVGLPREDEPTLFDIRHRITVDEYHRMAEAGVFGPDPQVELIEGVIVEKMVKLPPHVIATMLIERLFPKLVPAEYSVTSSSPIQIEGITEPEPDVLVIRGTPRELQGRLPTAQEVVLALEVADTSYSRDRGVKWRLYARTRVLVYWLLDLNRRRLEIHTDPSGEGESAIYRKTQIFDADDEVSLVLDGREVGRFKLAEILP
jgi:Uma2 family endonuclease